MEAKLARARFDLQLLTFAGVSERHPCTERPTIFLLVDPRVQALFQAVTFA